MTLVNLAVTGIASKAIHSYECSLISQLNLTDTLEVEEAIRVLKIDKVVGPSGPNISEMSMKPFFWGVTQLFTGSTSTSMEAYVIGIHTEARKVCYIHPINFCLLNMVGKLFLKILLTRVLCEVNKHWLSCGRLFAFRPFVSMMLQLACLVNRNFATGS